MKYRGHFTLIQPQGERQQYAATFSVDCCESPGYRLRRIAYGEFESKGAIGLSIEMTELIGAEIMPEGSAVDQISIDMLTGTTLDSCPLKDLDIAY